MKYKDIHTAAATRARQTTAQLIAQATGATRLKMADDIAMLNLYHQTIVEECKLRDQKATKKRADAKTDPT